MLEIVLVGDSADVGRELLAHLRHTVPPVVSSLNVLDIVDSVVGHDRGSGGEVLGVVSGPVSRTLRELTTGGTVWRRCARSSPPTSAPSPIRTISSMSLPNMELTMSVETLPLSQPGTLLDSSTR